MGRTNKTIEIQKLETKISIPFEEYSEFENAENVTIPCNILIAPKIHSMKWYFNEENIENENEEFRVRMEIKSVSSIHVCSILGNRISFSNQQTFAKTSWNVQM